MSKESSFGGPPAPAEPATKDEPSAALNASIVRVIDLRLLPLLCILYLLCFLDRSNLANAKKEVSSALDMDDAGYGFATSIFMIGYMIAEIPANLVLKRSRPSLWLGTLVILFGTVACVTVFVRNFTELTVLRFFLGLAEAGFPPGVLYYLNFWYCDRELASRLGIFLLMSSVANGVGSLLAFGILQMSGVGSLQGWQWLFLLEGAPAVLFGIIVLFYLPDHPSTCRWFSPEQRAGAVARLPKYASASASESRQGYNWALIGRLLKSPVFWLFALLNICTNIAMYGISAFLPAIIEDMGYSSLEANLHAAPVWFWQAVWLFIMAWVSDRTRERGWIMVGSNLVSCLGMFALAGGVHFSWSVDVQYALCYSMVMYAPTLPIMFTWMKKAYVSESDAAVGPAAVIMVGCIGGFLGPNIYGSSSGDNDSYATGHMIMGMVFAAGALIALAMRLLFVEEGGLLRVRLPCRAAHAAEEVLPLLNEPKSGTT
eukprot:m.99202 g.99202  ORF g.99202 m.99202 type:complete len:486 (-) comp8713_c0_seq2:1786-3243(-)